MILQKQKIIIIGGGILGLSIARQFLIKGFKNITILEKEIKESTISFYLFDFAPNTFAYFIDFFPSLEFIIENDKSNKLTT